MEQKITDEIKAILKRINATPLTEEQKRRMAAAAEREDAYFSSDDYIIHA